ncbi:MAG: DNA mismatch repair protein MutT, partial [Treponema sp.]|nr:DNA mismatch repair protein MutT [Treponema sp.]
VPEGSDLSEIFKLFASFSNVYEYRGINYNTCDMYFTVNAPGLKLEDLHPEQSEIAGICFLKPEEIDFNRFAFPSTLKAVKKYLNELPF